MWRALSTWYVKFNHKVLVNDLPLPMLTWQAVRLLFTSSLAIAIVLFLALIVSTRATRSNSQWSDPLLKLNIMLLYSATNELTWFSFILQDVWVQQQQPWLLFSNNMTTFHVTTNLLFHACTKHIELDYHFVHEEVALGNIVTCYGIYRHLVCGGVLTKLYQRYNLLEIIIGVRIDGDNV